MKNPLAYVGDAGDAGLISGSGRFCGGGNTHSSILACKIPWTEESVQHSSSDKSMRSTSSGGQDFVLENREFCTVSKTVPLLPKG